mmetsp:Transcript_50420/g.145324  ORF Transcript_50420/g.145324 Transcript_50420/m.145324 type:complete len:222 (-) Transcript_50420:912-1577(-)
MASCNFMFSSSFVSYGGKYSWFAQALDRGSDLLELPGSGKTSSRKFAMPPGGSRGHDETKSRKRDRSSWFISTMAATKKPNNGDLSVRPPAGRNRARSEDSSQSMRSSPQNIWRNSAGRNAAKLSTGTNSFKPSRNALTCSEIPVSNQKRAACSTKLHTFSTVTGRSAPSGHNGAPLKPVSKKHAPTRERYSLNDTACAGGVARNRSPKSDLFAWFCFQAS